MRFLSLILAVAVLLSSATASAQNKRAETENSYRQLRQSIQKQDANKNADPQTAAKEKLRSVDTWIKRNHWKELSVKDQAWLCETLSGADQIDKKAFSVRWSGVIRVPASGTYTFSQIAVAGAEGSFKLWINDQLVLDTTAVSATEGEETAAEPVRPTGTVSLTAGQSTLFRLDYVRMPVEPQPGVMRIPGFPAAVLAWQSDAIERQVVPPNVFLTDSDQSSKNKSKDAKPGLKGEYFADTTFTKRVAVRIDPNVDFMWDVGRVSTEYRDAEREIVAVTAAQVAAPGFLASLDPAEAKDFVQQQLPSLFAAMSASERVVVLQALSEQPALLKYLTFPQMAAALRWYSTIAESTSTVDLLVKWSKTAPMPQTQPGFYPGRGNGGYLNLNIEPHFRLARLFLGDKVDANIETLVANTSNDDGTCNLTVTYILCCVCRMANKPKTIANLMDAHLLGEENEKTPGDVRASWFIAETFKLETVYGSDFQPGMGAKLLDTALECAATPDMRFHVVGELLVRLISLDRCEEAVSLLMSIRDQYPDENKQTQMDAWLEKCKELSAYYKKIGTEKTEATDAFAAAEYAKELKRRAATAEKRGDRRNFERYSKSATAIEKQLDERQKKNREK